MTSVPYTLPPPIGGLNAFNSIDAMPETDAIVMENFFPEATQVSLRKGNREHTTTRMETASIADPVETLMSFSGEDGTKKLLAVAGETIYDVTSATPSSLKTGLTNSRWEYTNYRNTLIAVNGADTPQQYDGSTFSDAVYTGPASSKDLSDVTVYKERLFFLKKNTQSFWYGSAGNITGALSEFDVGRYLNLGGRLLTISSWTQDTGTGFEDMFIVVSEEGEVLAYTGTDPSSASTWSLVGRKQIPRPISKRAIKNVGGDLLITTEDGVYTFSSIFSGPGETALVAQVTKKIQDLFRSYASSYSSAFGWDVAYVPRYRQIVISIPQVSLSVSKQLVSNPLTGAWTCFSNLNPVCLCVHDGDLYMGKGDGFVYKANTGNVDRSYNATTEAFTSQPIYARLQWAYNYFNDRSQNEYSARAYLKRFVAVMPVLKANIQQLEFNIGMDRDFSASSFGSVVSISSSGGGSSSWDTSPWDTTPWASDDILSKDWYCLEGEGRAGALKIWGEFKGVNLSLRAAHLLIEQAGMI